MSSQGLRGRHASERGAYTVRTYDPEDRERLLALDEAVWDRKRTPEWLAWKYTENPYVDRPPIFVAETDDRIVGARPLLAFRMRAGDETFLALQPSDTMVHPDHRRRGLFTRLNRRAIEHYADTEAAFFFNFPNEQARPGYLKLGWRTVGERPTFYRIQNPAAFCGRSSDRATGRLLERGSALLARAYHGARSLRPRSAGEYDVVRHPDVPLRLVVSLYERRTPERIHALRDERFYRWRFASPTWDRSTYVAARDGTPVAALVTRTRTTDDGVTVTQLAEIVPLVGGSEWSDAVSTLIGRVVDDHSRSDLLSVASTSVPRQVLRAHGFRRDDRPPLVWGRDHHRVTVVRPLGGTSAAGLRFGGRQLRDERNWLLSFAERDTT